MNTFKGKSCSINHNSDMTGDAIICVSSNKVTTVGDNSSVIIKAEDLLNLISEYVKRGKIAKIENMSTIEILNSTWKILSD